MLASFIRALSSSLYTYPQTTGHVAPSGPFERLKVALVVDNFTESCLTAMCQVKNVVPDNYEDVLGTWRPDFLFVESAFHGFRDRWRYELAKQPLWLRQKKPMAIYRIVEYAKTRGIPTVFWNKDDGFFFDAFIDVAAVFDHIFTADCNSVARYRALVPAETSVHTLMMAYQPLYHSFTGFNFTTTDACFTGSYYRRILRGRRTFLDMLFRSVKGTGMTINVFDRNHDRFSRFYAFRFPDMPDIRVHPQVSYPDTARVYKTHAVSINVNSVVDSESMCSRRLLEILACGGIVLTNGSPCVEKYFKDFCHVVSTEEEAREFFSRMKNGPDKRDLEKAAEGARYVRSAHTWLHRLQQICAVARI